MLKTFKYKIRGFIWGFITAICLCVAVAYPHTVYRISASNQPIEQQVALDQSQIIADIMPATKPKEHSNEKR